MSTIAVLASAVFWAWLWGPVGLLLSTPLTVILVVIGKYVPQLQFLDIMLGDEPVLEPPVRLYQRLLALDAEEAADVARHVHEGALAAGACSRTCMLPALALAEQDRHRGRLDERAARRSSARAMRDLIEELSDLNRQQAGGKGGGGGGGSRRRRPKRRRPARRPAGRPPRAGRRDRHRPRASAGGNGHSDVPKDCTVNVVCLPAHDESDEIAGLMLAQLLQEPRVLRFTDVADRPGQRDGGGGRAHAAPTLVVVSALPPAAVAHARYLCKRLHGRFPEINMVVGLWTANGNLTKARDRLTCSESALLTTTFRQSLEDLHQLAQAAIVVAANATEPAAAGRV